MDGTRTLGYKDLNAPCIEKVPQFQFREDCPDLRDAAPASRAWMITRKNEINLEWERQMYETTAYYILEALSSHDLLSVEHTCDTANGEVSKRRGCE